MLVRYRDERGAINGAATVALLLRKDEIPCAQITDYPDTEYRSMMLDFARGLPKKDHIKNTLKSMALAKMNRVHIHLMDSEGICYRSEALPGLSCTNGDQFEMDELKSVIHYAKKLGLEIIPEIELPAHARAINRLYPEMVCDTDRGEIWDVCPGTEKTYEVYGALIKEVANLFPDSYIHVGSDELEFADEANSNALCYWDTCSKCAALREREGLSDRQAEYYYFMNRIYEMVKENGKKMMLWNDQIDIAKDYVPLSRDILIQFWRVAGEGRGPWQGCSMAGFLEHGFHVVNSFYRNVYTDLNKFISPEKMECWNPLFNPEVPEGLEHLVVGSEACAWEFGNAKEYSFHNLTVIPIAILFGDKLWDHRDRKYVEEDSFLMAEYLFGKRPENNILACVGSLVPPRDFAIQSEEPLDHLTFAKDLDPAFVRACIAELSEMEGENCAFSRGKYIAHYEKILSLLEK
jgi:hypothetical protein